MNWIYDLPNKKTKKYSQCGEEGYIIYILSKIIDFVNIKQSQKFVAVDIGAWDGEHLSNTKILEDDLGFNRVMIDGDTRGNASVYQAFVTAENISTVLMDAGCPKIPELLCIDIDGNDIYVLDAIMMAGYSPLAVVAEFNPIHQPDLSLAIQYNPEHTWNEDDYYGFSFAAGQKWANKWGYTLIFQNDDLNMYFVKNDSLAKSLGVDVSEINKMIPPVTYQQRNYHPKSPKTNWVKY